MPRSCGLAAWSARCPGARRRVLFSGALLALVVGLAIAGCGASLSRPPSGIELDGVLNANATYDSRAHALTVSEVYTLGNAALSSAVHSPLIPIHESVDSLARVVIKHARREGWQVAVNTDGLSLTQAFTQPVSEHAWLPGVTDNTLALRLPSGFIAGIAVSSRREQQLLAAAGQRFRRLPLSFVDTSGSTVTVIAPDRTILTTLPASSPLPTTDRREQRTISLNNGETTLGYEVISRAFRVEPLTALATATFWWPFKWLLALLIAGANDELRDRIRSLLRRRAARDGETAHTDPPPGPAQTGAKDAVGETARS